MLARIYQPSRNAMQSGDAKSRQWVLEYTPEESRQVDPLMGWTGSGDMRSQVKLTFDSQDAAIAYAKKRGIAYQVSEPKKRTHIRRKFGYGDNFAHDRKATWTH